ncbi:MAG: porin family protein [Holophagales bacterium]|jgi:opacity protein-like surface antigen|nr:porin family protein [Holophagales bacterium]
MNFSTTHKCLTRALVLALIAAAPLAAQEFRYGGQVSIANPTGDDSDIASMGFGAGLLGEMPFTDNFALRGRLQYMMFGNKNNVDVSSYSLMADGIYAFDNHDAGLFGIVSLGFANTSVKMSLPFFGSISSDSSGMVFGAGLGYNFNRNLGAEVKYLAGGDDNISYIQVSATWRF